MLQRRRGTIFRNLLTIEGKLLIVSDDAARGATDGPNRNRLGTMYQIL